MNTPRFNDQRFGAILASVYIHLGKIEAIKFLREQKPDLDLAKSKNTVEYYIPSSEAAQAIVDEFNDEKKRKNKIPPTVAIL